MDEKITPVSLQNSKIFKEFPTKKKVSFKNPMTQELTTQKTIKRALLVFFQKNTDGNNNSGLKNAIGNKENELLEKGYLVHTLYSDIDSWPKFLTKRRGVKIGNPPTRGLKDELEWLGGKGEEPLLSVHLADDLKVKKNITSKIAKKIAEHGLDIPRLRIEFSPIYPNSEKNKTTAFFETLGENGAVYFEGIAKTKHEYPEIKKNRDISAPDKFFTNPNKMPDVFYFDYHTKEYVYMRSYIGSIYEPKVNICEDQVRINKYTRPQSSPSVDFTGARRREKRKHIGARIQIKAKNILQSSKFFNSRRGNNL